MRSIVASHDAASFSWPFICGFSVRLSAIALIQLVYVLAQFENSVFQIVNFMLQQRDAIVMAVFKYSRNSKSAFQFFIFFFKLRFFAKFLAEGACVIIRAMSGHYTSTFMDFTHDFEFKQLIQGDVFIYQRFIDTI